MRSWAIAYTVTGPPYRRHRRPARYGLAAPAMGRAGLVSASAAPDSVSAGRACAPHQASWRARHTEPGRLGQGGVMIVTGLAVAAAAWGVLMGVSPVLQIRRMVRQRSSRDVSIGYFAILLIVPNAVALLIGASTIAVALRLGQGTHGSRVSAPPDRR